MGRAFVYVDGLALYHSVRDGSYKWLNILLLAQLILKESGLSAELGDIHYFTAKFKDSAKDAEEQQIYLDALERSNLGLTFHYGIFLRKNRDDEWEEKMTDVGIACQMISDRFTYDEEMEAVFLLSNDTDFVPALKAIRNADKKAIMVALSSAYNKKLAQEANSTQIMTPSKYKKCLLPDKIKVGKTLTRPEGW
ncbi:MAG: NYN domain-containing protein [Betaproteobacteria bacterium AqS2]|uniref:NYN domain-containing protein n=1 Tax=Candidatus Amphirhobacter heronislandensis TaxID=1732024 RepID=A0A930UHC4_9GAMM|nr:NYN domain-containing protein [Betaproteobacteria bacterium AqS2]